MTTPYFDSLFDNFGIWQHADGSKPLPEHGYALDDATRGLLACLALDKTSQAKTLFEYIQRSQKGTDFYGFYDAAHQPIQFPASEDAKGQVVWALGYAAKRQFEAETAKRIINELKPSMTTMQSLRGPAYALLGALYVDKPFADQLAHQLADRFASASDDWLWPEDTLTYANGIMPYALLRYALTYGDTASAALGRKILEFVERCCTTDRTRGPIGYEGWYHRGDQHPAEDGQQAIDAAYMIWAWVCAWQLSGNNHDLQNAGAWWQWFEGNNIAHQRMYDPKTLKTYDGIHLHTINHHTEEGINYHSGAESNICLILSKHILATRQTI